MQYQGRFSSVEEVTSVDAVRFLIAETQELVNQFKGAIEKFPRAKSIYRPFHPSYRPDIGAKATRSQNAAIHWRKRLMSRNSVMRDHYDLLDRGNELDRYPLAGFGSVPNFGYKLTADDCVDALERELFLLQGELKRRAANESPQGTVRAAQSSKPSTSQASSEHTADVTSLITARKAAEVLSLPLQRVYELARTGVLPAVRLGRQLRFDPTSLREFVRSGGRRSE